MLVKKIPYALQIYMYLNECSQTCLKKPPKGLENVVSSERCGLNTGKMLQEMRILVNGMVVF